MTEMRKSVLRSVRLDDEVWQAVKGMGCSLNQYLREALLGGEVVSVSTTPSPAVDPASIPGVTRGLPAGGLAFRNMCEHCGAKFDADSRWEKRCGECEEAGHGRSRYDCEECRLNA